MECGKEERSQVRKRNDGVLRREVRKGGKDMNARVFWGKR